MADFVFAKEVRLGTYAADRKTKQRSSIDDEDGGPVDPEEGQRPHSAIVSIQKMLEDPRCGPQYAERIPYVVVYGVSGASRLRELVASPDELIANPYLDASHVTYFAGR